MSGGGEVPSVSKEGAANREFVEGIIDSRSDEVGGQTVSFNSFLADIDPAPLFKGLPDDRCQCPHWGYVVEGKLTYRFADHDETYEAGEAYYVPPGHLPLLHAGSECVEFSPTAELEQTADVIRRNMEASRQG
jgi:glyoxylate utilization-related uncharacterized protein